MPQKRLPQLRRPLRTCCTTSTTSPRTRTRRLSGASSRRLADRTSAPGVSLSLKALSLDQILGFFRYLIALNTKLYDFGSHRCLGWPLTNLNPLSTSLCSRASQYFSTSSATRSAFTTYIFLALCVSLRLFTNRPDGRPSGTSGRIMSMAMAHRLCGIATVPPMDCHWIANG